MHLLFLLFFISLSWPRIESVLQVHHVVLEPIYRFTETVEDPMKGIYFTKLPQFQSVTQNSSLLKMSNFPAVRGFTQEMFLKDLNCGATTCQNLPIEVVPVFSVLDELGRLKFETTPTENMRVLGKAGYLAKDDYVGLVRYDEYFSQKDNLFAYVNGHYPNQFGSCQLRKYGEYRFKLTRTLGYAFTPIIIPNNAPIYTIFGFDDLLPDPSTTTPSPNSVVFTTNPIWTILKHSTNGIQGIGAFNLPWAPPVSATPIEPTGVCLLNGNFSLLKRCGDADRVLQYFDDNHTYIGFIDIANQGLENTYIYSYIGFMFRSSENDCDLPLKPIREFYTGNVGYTATVADDSPSGYNATGNVIGYTIDCQNAANGNITVTLPDDLYSSTTSSWTLSTKFTSSEETGFYVEPVNIVKPSNSSETLDSQGSWWGNSSDPAVIILNSTNVCLFVANSTALLKCGHASNLYLYHDVTDNFYFIGIQSFGRSVTQKAIGIAFSTPENACGLKLVPILELYKEGVGYAAAAGDDYIPLIVDGYKLTGNVLGWTVLCSDTVDGNWVIGHVPSFDLSTTSTSESLSTTPSDLVDIFVSPVRNITGGPEGYGWGSVDTPYSLGSPIPICLFVANSSFLQTCGETETLYQFFDKDRKFYFIGTDSFGRNVTSEKIGLAFKSAENLCELKLKPIRELYKEEVGFTAVAGNNYSHLTAAGYSLTGNVMGFTVKCTNATDKMICGHLPAYNWTTPATTSVSSTQPSTLSPNYKCDPNVINWAKPPRYEVEVTYSNLTLTGSLTSITVICNAAQDKFMEMIFYPYQTNPPGNALKFQNQSISLECKGDNKWYYRYPDNKTSTAITGFMCYQYDFYQCDPNAINFAKPPRYEVNVTYSNLTTTDSTTTINVICNAPTGKYMQAVFYPTQTNPPENELKVQNQSVRLECTGDNKWYYRYADNKTSRPITGFICYQYDLFNTTSTVVVTSTPSTTSESLSTTPSDLVDIFVSPVRNITGGPEGYGWGSVDTPYSLGSPIPICLFVANSSFLQTCGETETLYQFFDNDRKFYFIGTNSFGRNVESEKIGLAFKSAENLCGLKLKPIRELYKDGVGYTAVAGNNFTHLTTDGYSLTGNVMGFTVKCTNATEKMICGHLPASNWTTPATTTSVPETTTKEYKCDPSVIDWAKAPIYKINVTYTDYTRTGSLTSITVNCNADPDKWMEVVFYPHQTNPVENGMKVQNQSILLECNGDNKWYYHFADNRTTTPIRGFMCFQYDLYNKTTTVPPTTRAPEDCEGEVYTDNMFLIENPSVPASQGFNSWINEPFVKVATLEVCYFAPEWMSATVTEPLAPEWFSECGETVPLYHYFDASENYHFLSIDPFGRNVTEIEKVGIVFKSQSNKCGLDLRPMREVLKNGTGYSVVVGSDIPYSAGYRETGKILGYTLKCGTELDRPSIKCLNRYDGLIYAELAWNISARYTGVLQGYWCSYEPLYYAFMLADQLNVCIFTANQTFIPKCGEVVPLNQYFESEHMFYFFGISDFGRRINETVRIGWAFTSTENQCALDLAPMRELFKEGVGYTVFTGDDYQGLIAEGYVLTGNIMGYTTKCNRRISDRMIPVKYPANMTSPTTIAPFLCNPNVINWGRGNTRPDEISVTHSSLYENEYSASVIDVYCNADAGKWVEAVLYPYQKNPRENEWKLQNQTVELQCDGNNNWYYQYSDKTLSRAIQGYMCFQHDIDNQTSTVPSTTLQPTTMTYGKCDPNSIIYGKADGINQLDVHFENYSVSGPTSSITITCSSPPYIIFMEFNVNKGGPPVGQTVTVELKCNVDEQTWVYTSVVDGISYSMIIESVRCNMNI